ncbi:MAG TPA: multicopper oxidase [Bryobacteraceae bacterium]|jgi:spore coat protein A
MFLAGAAAVASRAEGQKKSPALDPNRLQKFVDPLPIPPVAKSFGARNHYRLTMSEIHAKVHRDLPPTRMWGFNGISPGPVIEARSGESISIEWANRLPSQHFLPIDYNLHGSEKDKPDVRAVVHVHGAKTRPEDDGYPEDWYVPGKSRTYHYPNNQEPTALWYHDHTMGINRLNVYAGLFGFMLIRDAYEDALDLPKGRYEIPLALYDRSFSQDGSLDYPDSGMPGMPWVPEAFGEAMLVNGKIFPFLEVEPRLYRFRLLNGSNSRFFHLSLSNGQTFIQIGTDQGLLPAPLTLDNFVIAPAERFDLLLDFSKYAGQRMVLRSDAFSIMEFRVSNQAGGVSVAVPATLRAVEKIPEAAAVETRRIPLLEMKSPNGDSMTMLLGGMHWDMPVTEKPVIDTVEIWEFVNTTEDSHPIHLHLVRFQILDRRSFDELLYFRTRQIRYTGPVLPPDPYEAGWKDTVRAHSKMITRILVRFEGYTGRYVWHCHLLEHEDNEMMRPYEVLAKR